MYSWSCGQAIDRKKCRTIPSVRAELSIFSKGGVQRILVVMYWEGKPSSVIAVYIGTCGFTLTNQQLAIVNFGSPTLGIGRNGLVKPRDERKSISDHQRLSIIAEMRFRKILPLLVVWLDHHAPPP
jgi:hypothetical protein